MAKTTEVDKLLNELHKRILTDENLHKELTQLSEVLNDIETLDDNEQHARWPYINAEPISRGIWRNIY